MQHQIILQGITVEELLEKVDSLIINRVKEQTKLLRKSKISDKEYLSGKEVEELLGITSPTRYGWEKKGLFSRYKVAGRTRYKQSEIIDALIKIENEKS